MFDNDNVETLYHKWAPGVAGRPLGSDLTGPITSYNRVAMTDSGVPDVQIVEGYAAVFNQPVNCGDWVELLAPGAFDDTLGFNGTGVKADCVSMWNHSADHLLGRASVGTLRLAVDDYGLTMKLDLPMNNYLGQYVHSMIERGDVYGASIQFVVEDEEWVLDAKPYKRIIKQVRLLEAGPVYEPAARNAKVALVQMSKALQVNAVLDTPVTTEPPALDWQSRMSLRLSVLSL